MAKFSERVLSWYERHGRVLPWRGVGDPYAVWVSEIMLQQTRVDTVIPYFERWMKQFPDMHALASASLQDVLAAWEGLGYYSRARNMHRAANMVVEQFGGVLPNNMHDLRKLPGVGRYTAAAVASIAYQQDEATLDANLRRVFARVFDVSIPADSQAGEEMLWGLARQNLPPGRAADYNQALMDLGASICLPKKPHCLLCPLAGLCLSRNAPEGRPVLKPKAAVPHRIKMAAVILRDGEVLLAQRPAKGLLGGMWEFPAVQVDESEETALVSGMLAEYALEVRPVALLSGFEHAYTHFRLTEFAWLCELCRPPAPRSCQWVAAHALEGFPMGKVDRMIAKKMMSAI